MDLDCLPPNLLILKCKHYGLSDPALDVVNSYLSNRKQCVKIGDNFSTFESIINDIDITAYPNFGPVGFQHIMLLNNLPTK